MDDRQEIAASRFSFLLWEVGQGGNSRGRAARKTLIPHRFDHT
jgi:hypothetical protein